MFSAAEIWFTAPARCVKCGESHESRDYERLKDEKVRCANCYRNCEKCLKKKPTLPTDRRPETPGSTTPSGFSYAAATSSSEEVTGRTNGTEIITMLEEMKKTFLIRLLVKTTNVFIFFTKKWDRGPQIDNTRTSLDSKAVVRKKIGNYKIRSMNFANLITI